MKIIFITTKMNTSGGSAVELDVMIRNLIKLGNEISVVTTSSSANFDLNSFPYPIIEDDIHSHRQLGIQWGVLKLLKKYSKQTDVFYIDGQVFLYGAGLYRLLGGQVPIFAYFNRELMSWPENISEIFSGKSNESILIRTKKKIRWYIERYILIRFANYVDYFAFTNPFLNKAYENFGLKTVGRHIIIGDPYDFKEIMKKNNITEDFYCTHNKKDDVITLFYSSRMVAGKGFDLLLTAFSKIKNKEKFKLVLGGAGPEEPLIRKMIIDFKLVPYIELPGWVSKEELHKSLKKADIFVQARWRTDMSSLSLTEAMIFGLPCIVPAGGGIQWVAGKSGLFFRPDDSDDLADKIEQFGSNYQLRAELSRQCFVRLNEGDVNYEKTIPKINKIMAQLSGANK